MNDNTIEKCIAMVVIGVMAIFGPKLGMTETVFGIAATGVAAMAGTGGVAAALRKRTSGKDGT